MTKTVLFDLDGTLIDTAPDLIFALNVLRGEFSLPPLPASELRPLISLGSRAMLKFVLGIDDQHENFNKLRESFLMLYQQHLADSTQFFPNIERVLNYLDRHQISWGIVTNKLTRHTEALLKALGAFERPGCIICGDTLATFKPDPGPILHACELLNTTPQNCIYVGDAVTDVAASKAAGTTSLVALYGYIGNAEDPYTWQADGYIKEPLEILNWL